MAEVEKRTAINPEALTAVQTAMPPDAVLDVVVQTFRALADPTRAQILYALIQRPLCVRDLAILTHVSESAVSHQLSFLRNQHLIKSRRAGNVIYYSVNDPHLAVLFHEAEHHADHVYRNLPDHP